MRLRLGARPLSGNGAQSSPSEPSLPRHEPQTMGGAAARRGCSMTTSHRHHRPGAKTGLPTSRPPPDLVQKKPEIEPHSRTTHCAKPSQAGEGRGEGISAVGVSEAPEKIPGRIEPSPGAS